MALNGSSSLPAGAASWCDRWSTDHWGPVTVADVPPNPADHRGTRTDLGKL
jgi:hypothetical protein